MIEVSNYESSLFLFRDLEEKDANQLLKIYSDKEAMKYRRNPPMIDIEDALNFISNQKTETAKHYKLRKGVTLKVEQELIGTVMYKYKKKNEKECIIGYSIGRALGKGIGKKNRKKPNRQFKSTRKSVDNKSVGAH